MKRLYGVLAGHRRLFAAFLIGCLVWLWQPLGGRGVLRLILAWDAGIVVFLAFAVQLFVSGAYDSRMEANARAQEEGEWTVFALTLAAILLSVAAILAAFSGLRNMPGPVRTFRVSLVVATLGLSWLMTHVTFALRYAHEFYATGADGRMEGGLEFPRTERPDYFDFVYFSFVIGMTFQVSDVAISSRKFRRLATLHGLVGFLFNTVILALVVNLAAGLV